jgi:hypothetical protein
VKLTKTTFRAFLCVLLMLTASVALSAKSGSDKFTLGLLTSSDIKGTVMSRQGAQEARGRLNLKLAASPEMLKQGLVQANDVTLAMFGVDYRRLTPKTFDGKSSGAIGFTPDRSAKRNNFFTYDAKTGQLRTQIRGEVDSALLSRITLKPKQGSRKDVEDFFEVATQRAILDLSLQLDRPIPTAVKGEPIRVGANVTYQMSVEAFRNPQISGFTVQGRFYIPVEIYPWVFYETAQTLCVQPVSIRSGQADQNPTGDYYSVGMNGARVEWAKADVIFEPRPWRRIYNEDWKVASESELSAIRASVTDDDCIEIFFVENHDPVNLHGGGAAWGGGRATSQIVTSDGNNNGIDFTHLAHELGHVLALRHPWADSGEIASTGTLMCGSGWRNDNPQVNSQENKNKLSNPLLKLSVKRLTSGPDCRNSTDCGPC